MTYNCGRVLFPCCIKKSSTCLTEMLPGMTALTYRVFFFLSFNCTNGLSARWFSHIHIDVNSAHVKLFEGAANLSSSINSRARMITLAKHRCTSYYVGLLTKIFIRQRRRKNNKSCPTLWHLPPYNGFSAAQVRIAENHSGLNDSFV